MPTGRESHDKVGAAATAPSESLRLDADTRPAGLNPSQAPELAHVLFMDLVGYSKLPMEQQTEYLCELQVIIRDVPAFQSSQKDGRLICLPTGDGMALVFFSDPVAAVQCAVEIAGALRSRPHLKLRMGVHSGPVYRVSDINANQNVSGGGINLAQRVMDCGDAGHILISKAVADVLFEFSKWSGSLTSLGEREVKHGVKIHLFNLCNGEVGNRAPVVKGLPRPPLLQRSSSRWIAALVVPILLLLGWYLFRSNVPKQKLVAVLPFQNVGGDPANRPFCDGLVETLTSKITEVQQFQEALWVVSANEVRREAVSSPREAKLAFGVNLVVTGSVQRAGNQVRLTTNLVDAKTLRQLQAVTVDAPVDNMSLLQDAVVGRCVRMLELVVRPQARRLLAAGGTAVSKAYDSYLHGEGYLQRFDEGHNLDMAIAAFQKAVELDSSYALAYTGLGKAYWQKYQSTKDTQWVEQARVNCLRAVELADQIAITHVNLGQIYAGMGMADDAVREFRRALELDPVNAEGNRGLAFTYSAMGKLADAETAYKHAIELRPNQWAGYSQLGVFYYSHGRYAEAEQLFRRVTELSPDYYIGYKLLGGLYLTMERYQDAARILEKSLAIRPMAGIYNNLGNVYFFEGRYQDAARMIEKAIELRPNDYRAWAILADTYRSVSALAAKAPAAYQRAIELARQQVALNPKNGEVLSNLAVYQAKTSDKQEALASIERSLQLAPDNKDVVQNAVIVYEITGNRDRALHALQEALNRKYPLEEVHREPLLAPFRKDPHYLRLIEGQPAGG